MTTRGSASFKHHQNPIQQRPPSIQMFQNESIDMSEDPKPSSSYSPETALEVSALRISLEEVQLRDALRAACASQAKRSANQITEVALSPLNHEQEIRNSKRHSLVSDIASCDDTHLSVTQCAAKNTKGCDSFFTYPRRGNSCSNKQQDEDAKDTEHDSMDEDDGDDDAHTIRQRKRALTLSPANASLRSPGIYQSKSCGAQPKEYIYSYNAWYTKRVIKMSKRLTRSVIPRRIKESIADVFDFINKLTTICLYDGLVVDVGNSMILNCGFHDQNSNDVLYLVATKQSKSRVYKIHDKVYTKYELCNSYRLQEHELPQSYYDRNNMRCVMNEINYSFDVDYRSVQWHKLPVLRTTKNKSAKYNKQRLTFFITKTECIATVTPKRNSTLIPIIMFNCNGYRREYVQIVSIGDGIDIGVSYFYNECRNCFQATAIHLNKDILLRQHQLADPHHHCGCLDGFQSMIDDLHIGNPDDDKNRVKDLQRKNSDLKKENTALKQRATNPTDNRVKELEDQNLMLLSKMNHASQLLVSREKLIQALQIEVNCLKNLVLKSPILPPIHQRNMSNQSLSSPSNSFIGQRVPSLSLGGTPATPSLTGYITPVSRRRGRSTGTPVASHMVTLPFSQYNPNMTPQAMNNAYYNNLYMMCNNNNNSTTDFKNND
eukprot:49818_1